MRRFTHPARRSLCLPLLLAGIALTAGCGTSQTQAPQRVGADGDSRGTTDIESPADDREFRDSAYGDLFVVAEDALAGGDWMSAQLALPHSTDSADPEFIAYGNYIRARIAWQRGHLEAMTTLLANPADVMLSDELALKILQLQRQRAQLESRHLDAARLSIRILQHLTTDHPDIAADSRRAWHSLRRVPDAVLREAATDADSDLEAGWLSAARLSRSAARMDDWRARYPGHPAETVLSSEVDQPAPRRVALLLPLSGRIADAAAAVRDGFIARYYAERDAGGLEWDIIVLDTGDYTSATDAYNAAIDSGAQLVVGPLTKAAVTELLTTDSLPIPVIALNRAGNADAVHDNALQFALAPEDEAAQVARLAFADGRRRALLVRPAGEWGTKMEQALRDSWLQLGGSIAATATFSSRETHSSSLTAALALDASRERGATLRRQLAQSIETSGRRREDIDAVFLLAPSAAEARSLKPLLAYHYAGSLPAYATSSANSDESPGKENDLNGLQIVEMPKVLGADTARIARPLRSDGYERLAALGADACRLAGLGLRSPAAPGPILQGETGFLSVNGQGQIERDLEAAVFDRGALRHR